MSQRGINYSNSQPRVKGRHEKESDLPWKCNNPPRSQESKKKIIIISIQHKTKIAPERDHIPQSLTRGV